MIITAGLVVKGFVISKLFIWMMGVLTAWSLYQLGKAHFSAFAGIFAASMFLALPMTLKMNLQGNIDMATAFFGVLALHTFLDGEIINDSRPS
jgi:4-amino-4-deoxy-L-arabinose transferase-like glycosyltransferase